MNLRFEAVSAPSSEEIEKLSAATPHTPFNTPAFAAACNAIGKVPCLFLAWDGPDIVAGSLGLFMKGLLSSRLEIMTAPGLLQSDFFWNGVRAFCWKHGVWDLEVGSYASKAVKMPSFPNGIIINRIEYWIDLIPPTVESSEEWNGQFKLAKGRKGNLVQARKANLTVRRTRHHEAIIAHRHLMMDSMQRRRDRGEEIELSNQSKFFGALMASGAGELFQAMDQQKVLSSMLIVRSPHSAYYQTGGTSHEGMQVGASTFLLSEVAGILKSEGVGWFNLGGANKTEEGLRNFKKSFGARAIALESATFSMVSPMKRKCRAIAKIIHKALLKVFSSS